LVSRKSLILIVDDQPENIDILSDILKDKYDLSVAINGEKALKVTDQVKPDLILLDIMMPVMDGYSVCERLKSNKKTENIPIIFLTAKSQTDDIVKGFNLGAVDYVLKPFSPVELRARIKTHLDLQHSHKVLRQQNEELNLINFQISNKAHLSDEKAEYLAERINKILTSHKDNQEQIDKVKELIPLIATNDLGNLKVVLKILEESRSVIDTIIKDPNEEFFKILSSTIEPLQTAIADIDSVIRVFISMELIDIKSISEIEVVKTSFYEILEKIYLNGRLSQSNFKIFLDLAKFKIKDEAKSDVTFF